MKSEWHKPRSKCNFSALRPKILGLPRLLPPLFDLQRYKDDLASLGNPPANQTPGGRQKRKGKPLIFPVDQTPVYPPQPYQFGYDSNDEYGNTAYRKESGDTNGRVQGSYGYKDAQGIERVVEYVADEHGYRAQ
ncbi:hypothetical protein AVEN_85582-1, partial [Araneus ventricosus]